jgi:hypothetical protein
MRRYYAFIKDKKIMGSGQCPCSGNGITCIEIEEEVFNNIDHYMYKQNKIVLNPDWEQEQYNAQRKEEILARLEEIDNKSIRALRANDTEYIEAYELEAIALREELRVLNDNI